MRWVVALILYAIAIGMTFGQGTINPVKEEQMPDMPSISRLKEVSMPTPSLVTGAVEFEVPLYTLTAEDFLLPLTLRYRSNGIKPDDDPYPLGLGWSLSPGLRITRSIRGRPDVDFPFFDGDIHNPTYGQMLNSVARYDRYAEQKIWHNIKKIDPEHDIFYVLLPDITLVLMYVDGKFIGVNCDEYKINAKQDLREIEVVSPTGLIYRFVRQGQKVTIDFKTYNVEWLLSEVELTSGNKVEFIWELTDHKIKSLLRYTSRLSYGYLANDKAIEYDGESHSRSYTSSFHEDLSEIRYQDCSITFDYDYLKNEYGTILKSMDICWEDTKKYSIGFGYKPIPSNAKWNPVLLSYVDHYALGRYGFDYYPNNTIGEFDRWGFSNGVETTKNHVPEVELKYALTKSSNYRINGRSFDISETHMKSNLLKSVRYPTGGRVEWNYGVHEFEPVEETAEISALTGSDRLEKGGGLRVMSIWLYQSDSDDSPRIRSYSYGKGKCASAPLRSTFLNSYRHESVYKFSDGKSMRVYYLRRNVVEINNVSDYLEYQDGALPIWYEEVTEYDQSGKTEYKFKSFVPPNRIRRKFGRILPDSLYSVFSSGPMMVEKKVYKSRSIDSGNLEPKDSMIVKMSASENTSYENLYTEYYDYEVSSLDPISNLAIKRKTVQTQMTDYAPDFCLSDTFYMDFREMNLPVRQPLIYTSSVPFPDSYNNEGSKPYPHVIDKFSVYDRSTYAVVPMRERLKTKKRIDYASGELTTIEEYSYIPGTGIINRVTTSRKGESNTLELGYVPDDSIGQIMRERNMVGVVTSSTSSFGGCLSKAEYSMATWSGRMIKPKTLTLSRGATDYLAQSYLYDSRGNIREIKRPDGFCTSYLWGYGGLYPVYKFAGKSFDSLRRIFGTSIESTDARSLNLDLSLADCPAEYAEYSPLAGISVHRDAAGVTTRYKYDASGRLAESTIDGHGVVATYDYNIGNGLPNHSAENIWIDESGTQRKRSVETFDGLGRSISRVNSYPQGLLAEYTVYDEFGHPVQAWLPTPVDSEHPSLSDIRSSAMEAYSDSRPFSVSTYEGALEGRKLAVMRAGETWSSADKKSHFNRRVNTKANVWSASRYEITANGVEYKGTYPSLTLLMEETIDEDGLAMQTYTDFRGLKVAEKRGSAGSMLCTRYVYDGYGDLRYVLPPKLADGTYERSDSEFQELAYWYDYDVRGNVTVRKLPGRAAIHYRYDSAGRLVAEQDGNTSPRWQLYFYDRYGRVAVEAEVAWSDSELAAFLSTPCSVSWTGSGALGGYEPERTLPRAVDAVHVVRRYDRAGRVVEETAGQSVRRQSYNRLGQLDTVRVSYGDKGVVYSYLYDYRGNCIGEKIDPKVFYAPSVTISNLYDQGGRQTTTMVSRIFTGRQLFPRLFATPNDTLAGIRREYDRQGRISRCRRGVRINTYYSYDTPGNLYAIRNEVILPPEIFDPNQPLKPFRSSSADAFYGDAKPFPDPFEVGLLRSRGTYIFGDTLLRSEGKVPLYNGRISSRKVREGRYDYGYDSFGRLTEAAFSGNDLADYSTEYSYDANANITGLIRKGVVDRAGKSKIYGILDATGVTLEGNRAVGYDIEYDGDVFEGRTGFGNLSGYCEVQYDDNGNVAYDETTMTAYSYNRHNKPVLIEADDGSSLSFEYDGTGTLISRTQTSGGVTTKTEYIGPYELVDGEFKAAYFDGGYFDADGMVHYYVPDYQGNIIADVTADGEIVQTASYYPYGEPWLEPEGDNRRLYGGKERLNFGPLRHSDYGPRLLDTRSGRWNSQDAYGEKYRHLSPYSLCGGDPINNIYPSGNIIQTIINGAAYQYINGSNGWGFYYANQKYNGNDTFVLALTAALQQLQKGDLGKTLIDVVVSNSKTVKIKSGKYNDDDKNTYDPSNQTITWDSDLNPKTEVVDIYNNITRESTPSFIVLGHEMAHAEDHITGNYKNKDKNIENEKRAVFIENFFMIEQGYDKFRVGHSGVRFFPNYQENLRTFKSSFWTKKNLIFRKYLNFQLFKNI